MIFAIGCSTQNNSTANVYEEDKTEAIKKEQTPVTADSSVGLSEKERYAKLEAAFTCRMLAIKDDDELLIAMQEFPAFAQKAGFSAEKVEELKTTYKDDNSFQMMAYAEMNVLCPELLTEAIQS